MISSVTKEIAGEPHTFRLKTRAKRAIEGRLECGFMALMASLESDYSINALTVILAESMKDGAGASDDAAEDVIDNLGDEKAAELLGEIVEAAFPDAKEGASKNRKGASRSK